MKRRFTKLIVLCMMTVLAFSCGKDDDPVVVTNTSLLTSHEWKFSGAKSDDTTTKSLTELIYSGSTWKFQTNGTYSGKLGPTLDNEEFNGTWMFTKEEKQLVLDKNTSDETIYDVLKLTADELHIKADDYTLEFKK